MSLQTFFIWAATFTLGFLSLIWSVGNIFNIFVKAWLFTLTICGIILLVRM